MTFERRACGRVFDDIILYYILIASDLVVLLLLIFVVFAFRRERTLHSRSHTAAHESPTRR